MIEDFETDRLSIRPLRGSDADFLIELDGDPDVMRYITGRASTPGEVRTELPSAAGTRWLVFDRSNNFLGWVGGVPNAEGSEHDFHLEFDDPLPGTELGEVEYEITRTMWESLIE